MIELTLYTPQLNILTLYFPNVLLFNEKFKIKFLSEILKTAGDGALNTNLDQSQLPFL